MSLNFVIGVAILLGLLLFLFREVRWQPGPMDWGKRSRWKKPLRVGLASTVVLIALLLFWAFLIEPNRLVTRYESVRINNWPRELSGLKIAVLSDIHVGSAFIDDKKLRLIVERTNQLNPDIIVILGDYMTGDGWSSRRVQPEVFSVVLKDLHAPFGVYSVLGNHDWWFDGHRIRVELEKNGIHDIENDVSELKIKNTSLWLAGLADLWTRPQHVEQTISRIPPGAPIIALTHNPDLFARLSPRVSLLLAGHTHGGQVRFPIIGTVIQPSNYGQRYVKGHVFENNHHLFVTSGIGTSIMPVRFLVPPEIVLLTVESTQ